MLCFDSEKMNWYYHVLARRPYLVVVSLTVFCVACIIVSLIQNDLPDFSDPTLGFETRGTVIGKRLTAWHNLDQEVDGNGILFSNPAHLLQKRVQYERTRGTHRQQHPHPKDRKNQRRKSKKNKRRKEQQKRNGHDDLKYKMLVINKHPKVSKRPFTYEMTNDSSLSLVEPTRHNDQVEYGHNTTFVDEDEHRERIQIKKSTWLTLKNGLLLNDGWSNSRVRLPDGFCVSSPDKQYSHFVVKRIGPSAKDSLFDLNGMLAMCQLQEQIAAIPSYQAFCEPDSSTSEHQNNCCRPWSLPNYATLLANKSSCFDLTAEDVVQLQSLLLNCYEYYHFLKLNINCNELNSCYPPEECTNNDLIYNIFNFLSDYNFVKLNDTHVYVQYAMIFVPIARSNRILPLFHEWQHVELSNDLVEVVAMDLGLDNELFSELLVTDVWLVSLGGLFVMSCVWLYTGSAFITLMSCCAICFSLGLAYFAYTLVFEFDFFPYMNLLAVVVIIGIGADDVFLFLKIWQCVLAERFSKSSTLNTQSSVPTPLEHNDHTETLENLMALTMRHAAASMFVTSVTTAGAFYASYSSSITAIKCFGVFAGTVVVTNYLLMITWLPASVSIMERLFVSRISCQHHLTQKLINTCKKSINRFCESFEECITQSIMNYAYLWLFIFTLLGISSAIIVLWYPGLQLPEKPHIQLFVSSHPFEVYTKLKHLFWFEKRLQGMENFNMTMRFVWGVEAVDDGDYTNPNSYGNLHYDNNFNISSKPAQIWLRNFCLNIREQPFYQPTFGFLLPNCFIENFIRYMERRCIDDMDRTGTDRTPCCEAEFPYEPHIFEQCLPQCISSLWENRFYRQGKAGPKFAAAPSQTDEYMELNSNETLSIESSSSQLLAKAIVIEFDSNTGYSTLYANIKQFYETIESWFQEQLSTAPMEMRGGWFISDLKFYNVQDTLSHDTITAILLAMVASLIVLLCFTMNFVISIYAVITVTLTICNTVAVLILLGWQLNILESIAVSTAIGLSVDFSLHYGIHYRLSPTKDRIGATQFALSRIIGPTVMAAATTAFAGGIMMASNILPYIQIGVFLVVVMITSWLYATFFLMSLLKVAGPQYGFMQLGWPTSKKRRTVKANKFYERKPSRIIATEQLLTPTSSAIVEMANSETHELESLNSNNQIKTISGTESTNNPASMPVEYEHSFQTLR